MFPVPVHFGLGKDLAATLLSANITEICVGRVGILSGSLGGRSIRWYFAVAFQPDSHLACDSLGEVSRFLLDHHGKELLGHANRRHLLRPLLGFGNPHTVVIIVLFGGAALVLDTSNFMDRFHRLVSRTNVATKASEDGRK